MRFCDELMTALPGEDWQRLETWAAVAGMTPAQYVAACIRRGHSSFKDELKSSVAVIYPGREPAPESAAKKTSRWRSFQTRSRSFFGS